MALFATTPYPSPVGGQGASSTASPTTRICPLRACPTADTPEHGAACRVADHPEQGWSLLCNGVVCFEDTGELLPGGRAVSPHRPTDPPAA